MFAMTAPASPATTPSSPSHFQTVIGAGVILLALGLATGALGISSEAGYGGVGPNFLPWVVALALLLCGGFMLFESRTGGFRALDEAPGAAKAYWPGFVWVSAGLLANAALITSIGFIFSCTLCFVLAVQGLRGAQGDMDRSPSAWLKDVLIGLAISAPVYWTFTQFLAINLPGITGTGWL
jgi:putative tricarboxylic transport membrane protein